MPLPRFGGAVFVLGCLLGLEILIAAAYQDIAGAGIWASPGAYVVVVVLANGVVFTSLMSACGVSYKSLFHHGPSSLLSTLVVLLAPIALLVVPAQWWLAALNEWLLTSWPFSQWVDIDRGLAEIESFLKFNWASFATVCVVAPLLEEMLFRGLILRGFLIHYTPAQAILLQALLFAVFHFNWVQALVAFSLGLVAGWLYWRTRSLIPAIAAHALFNGAAFWLAASDPDGGMQAHISMQSLVLSLLCSVAGAYWLWRIIGRDPRSY